MSGVTAGLRGDVTRLIARLDALAAIGPLDGGGSCRVALTDADRDGRALVLAWMLELGLDVRIDQIGNVIGTWVPEGVDPTLAPVLTGSHVDTVRTGGRFDGNLGVLAGLEVVETLQRAGARPGRPLAVGLFTNEEGCRFQPDMLGSLVYVGGLALEEALDAVAIDGARLGDELARIGFAGPAPCPGPVPHAFVELHVEQGPLLEAEGLTIGAVEGVQGISWQELRVTGQSNHAGTTPMALRHDAAFAAAAVVAFVRRLALEMGGDQIATVGRLRVQPDLVNVVAAAAELTVDLRNTDALALHEAERRLEAFCAELARDEGVTIESRCLARFEPVAFDPAVVGLVEQTAKVLGHRSRRMPSGAGHDAQMFARVCPAGMVFVPSVGGLSHNPAELTLDADLAAGLDVLLHVVADLAGGAA